jgi:hypothetical protein
VNLVTFYTAMVCQKRSRHAQPLMDFLARAFVASGNVISLLSAKSPGQLV